MPIDVQCASCGKRYDIKDSLAGRNLPCKECGAGMPVPHSGLDHEEDFGDDGNVSEPAPSRRKRSESKKTTRGKLNSSTSKPGVLKRIFAVLGVLFGIGIVLFGAYGVINGHMRAGRAIGGGLVMASVSFGWLLGNSN